MLLAILGTDLGVTRRASPPRFTVAVPVNACAVQTLHCAHLRVAVGAGEEPGAITFPHFANAVRGAVVRAQLLAAVHPDEPVLAHALEVDALPLATAPAGALPQRAVEAGEARLAFAHGAQAGAMVVAVIRAHFLFTSLASKSRVAKAHPVLANTITCLCVATGCAAIGAQGQVCNLVETS